jgi:hypothetical protein
LTAPQKSRLMPNLRMKAWRSFGFADLRMARAEKFPFIAPPWRTGLTRSFPRTRESKKRQFKNQ